MQQLFGSMLRPTGSESDFAWALCSAIFLWMLAGIGFDWAGCCSSSGACFAQQGPKVIFHGPFSRPVFPNTGRHRFQPSRFLQLFGGMLRPTGSESDLSWVLAPTSFCEYWPALVSTKPVAAALRGHASPNKIRKRCFTGPFLD